MEKHSCESSQQSNNQKLSQCQCPAHWVSPHAGQQNTANALFCLQIQPCTRWFETHRYIFFFFSPHSTCTVPFQEHQGLLKTNIYWILTRQGTATYSKSMGITNVKRKWLWDRFNPGPVCVASLQASVDSLKPCTLGQLASLNGLCVYLRVNVDGCWYFLLSLPTFAPNSAGISTSTPTILTWRTSIDRWMESTEVRVIPETQQSSHAHLPHGSCCLL